MNNINRVQLLGNLTRPPELRTTASGKTLASFSVATNRRWKDENNEMREAAEFHNCVAWGGLAEKAGSLPKGAQVFIEGRLQTRSWEKPDGGKAYRTEVVADALLVNQREPAATAPAPQPVPDEPPADGTPTIDEVNVDDIPF